MSTQTVDYKKFYEKQVGMRKKYSERRRVRIELLMEKCVKMGVIVTDSEIDDRIKNKKK